MQNKIIHHLHVYTTNKWIINSETGHTAYACGSSSTLVQS